MKPFLHEHTLKKIVAYDKNRSVWEPALKEVIRSDKLAERFGGSLKVPVSHNYVLQHNLYHLCFQDPLTGKVPERFYNTREFGKINFSEYSKADIAQGTKLILNYTTEQQTFLW